MARDILNLLYTLLPAQEWLEETESDTVFTDKAVEAAATSEQALGVTNNGDSSSAAAGPAGSSADSSPPKLPSCAPTSASTSPKLDEAHKPASHRVNRA